MQFVRMYIVERVSNQSPLFSLQIEIDGTCTVMRENNEFYSILVKYVLCTSKRDNCK